MKNRIRWIVVMAVALSFNIGILFSGVSTSSYAAEMVPSARAQVKAVGDPNRNVNKRTEDYKRSADKVKEVAPNVPILVSLTYPVGFSPKVFTKGWLFGARCMKGSVDISGNVRWKGTGTFNPDRGPLSRPSFNSPGTNQITLYIEENGKVVFEKTFTVEAVDPTGYARLNDIAQCPPHAHGCPACPHTVQGPIKSGSPLVFIGGIPAARVGDNGIHAVCCGPNTFVIKTGDPNVLIEGKPAARLNDQTLHCNAFTGKIGVLVNR